MAVTHSSLQQMMDEMAEDKSVASLEKTSSIKVDHRTTRSFANAALQIFIRRIAFLLMKQKLPQPEGSPQLKPHRYADERTPVVEEKVGDMWTYRFINDCAGMDRPKASHTLCYFAGGSFTSPAAKEHWLLCSELAVKLPAYRVLLVSYPLAPNQPAEKALPALHRFYHTLEAQCVKDKTWLTFAGDSSGGNVALTLGLYAASSYLNSNKRDTCRLRNVFVISPPTDFRNENPAIDEVARQDPLLSRKTIDDAANAWRGDWPAAEPQVSPIFADLSLFRSAHIKVDGVVAGYDVLGPDATVFRKRLAEVGVRGDWLEWDKQVHCFPLMWSYHIKEGKAGKDWCLDVLQRNAHFVDRSDTGIP
ncbi:alpha/beta-Hydrolase [Glarea lozoyensis ATCC 20868]|uniref:Alpha/beta-Hydrolase n=1 Tax=Glarea lozoyensis (strain ATCC 20868 / MF5171) TaxID=1116229 RepID=S3DGL6_GLAL2|nr:alpha/beta-Hydrolase [Glarea lozoyensis ATCC 20868]EPE31176.1 alpha/beta-Hydrolase [Glarea lozoyensis ATCC 20868]